MKFFFFSILVLSSMFSVSLAQSYTGFPKKYKVLSIKPSDTDSKITEANTPHLVAYNPEARQGKLLFFMPGTGGVALKGPKKLFATAVSQGYHVINISYINRPAVAQICRRENLAKNSKCTSEFRTKRLYGNNDFSLINDEPQDAIISRLTKLLIYLSKTDKAGNWGVYLKDGKPKWSEIAVSGQSQGGGMAAFIAKEHLVARVIDFSGGWDYATKNKIAGWYFDKSVTPVNLWYGTYHVTEPKAKTIKETYDAMEIPENHIYPFNLPVPEGKKGHSNGVRNIGYVDQWIELLGKGN
ncbi:BPSS1187 family protein [Polaribacter sp. Asnod1-A03]|uniref:BPSS1187 family protein n=1 Tax=Polaribacter sp. Asnod1-A03 TaxID=3160581 RepID=UPI003866E1C0